MTWNEIQAKWAAMARRVRSDLPFDEGSPLPPVRQQSLLQRSASDTGTPMQLDRSDA